MSLLLALLVGINMLPDCAYAQVSTQSNPAPGPRGANSDSSSWLFPIEKLGIPPAMELWYSVFVWIQIQWAPVRPRRH
jgi:hypothetical protein